MTDVVLVDKDDKILGLKEKLLAHRVPVPLHRAISVVIFNKDKTKMLITKRAKAKPTWGGFWSNAVCSHPFPNETYKDAAERRVFEELGIKIKLKEGFNFIYSAKMVDEDWGENEIDNVFIGTYEGDVNPDPGEVEEYRWIKLNDLKADVSKNSGKYTPWFIMILKRLKI